MISSIFEKYCLCSCLPGHVLEGEETVTCTSSGLWSNRAPSCRYVDCGQVPNLDDGSEPYYVNGSTHLDSLVRYSCDRSHSLIGNIWFWPFCDIKWTRLFRLRCNSDSRAASKYGHCCCYRVAAISTFKMYLETFLVPGSSRSQFWLPKRVCCSSDNQYNQACVALLKD